MKVYYLLLFLLVFNFAKSQNEYTTKSGVVYKVNDTLLLGKPSTLLNSMVVGTSAGGWNTIFKLNGKNLSNVNFINKKVILSKIEFSDNGVNFYFELFKQKLYVKIEEAILSGEVIPPFTENLYSNQSLDKYDKIKKIKELFDIGALTKEEFETEKSKLLNSN
ncbi:SHOCT domain-containing protein [Flavobacterium sp.]|jgi:hypothetical protein|uniref:SHOCT domain-containing protein n=1 Tax=Flavobacterium sp. TaxID=239 RepID=UPI0037BE28D1